VPRLLVWLVLLAACASAPARVDERPRGLDDVLLISELAHNATELVLLESLHEGDRDAAIAGLQHDLDVRVVWLSEILDTYRRHPAIAEKRDLIVCHLQAIKRYRAEHGAQSKDPELARMAERILLSVPECQKKCPQREATPESGPESSCIGRVSPR